MTAAPLRAQRTPDMNQGMTRLLARTALIALIVPAALPTVAADDAADLAKQLSNPVAALISVPLQYNYDSNIGPARDGERSTINIQPVIPIELNDDWNLISRTILPITFQNEIYPGAGSQSGTGDVLASAFFSPKKPTAGGWIWGAGPALLLPTGSNRLLTADKWGVGPTALVLKQQNGWTYGALVNHIWSFAGNSNRADVSSTFLQPFLSYGTPTAWTFGINVESSYDWENEQWSVPLNVSVSKVTHFGTQLVSVGGGLRYWVDSPDSGPHDIGFRVVITLLFPQKG
jgi:hypothetical protein